MNQQKKPYQVDTSTPKRMYIQHLSKTHVNISKCYKHSNVLSEVQPCLQVLNDHDLQSTVTAIH